MCTGLKWHMAMIEPATDWAVCITNGRAENGEAISLILMISKGESGVKIN